MRVRRTIPFPYLFGLAWDTIAFIYEMLDHRLPLLLSKITLYEYDAHSTSFKHDS